jgi:hypothetical protein
MDDPMLALARRRRARESRTTIIRETPQPDGPLRELAEATAVLGEHQRALAGDVDTMRGDLAEIRQLIADIGRLGSA